MKLGRWVWPVGLATSGIGAAAAFLFKGCRHTHLSWPIQHDGSHAYRVCTDCGAKRLFDPIGFIEYGPYSHDIEALIARDCARKQHRITRTSAAPSPQRLSSGRR